MKDKMTYRSDDETYILNHLLGWGVSMLLAGMAIWYLESNTRVEGAVVTFACLFSYWTGRHLYIK